MLVKVYSKYGSAHSQKSNQSYRKRFWLKKEAVNIDTFVILVTKREQTFQKDDRNTPIMDYPKNYQHDVEITKITVENNKWKD